MRGAEPSSLAPTGGSGASLRAHGTTGLCRGLGRATGLEPATSRITIRRTKQLSHARHSTRGPNTHGPERQGGQAEPEPRSTNPRPGASLTAAIPPSFRFHERVSRPSGAGGWLLPSDSSERLGSLEAASPSLRPASLGLLA